MVRRFPSRRHAELGDECPLLEEGVIDSLGVLDLLTFLETSFGICVADDDLSPENFRSIQALVRFVEANR